MIETRLSGCLVPFKHYQHYWVGGVCPGWVVSPQGGGCVSYRKGMLYRVLKKESSKLLFSQVYRNCTKMDIPRGGRRPLCPLNLPMIFQRTVPFTRKLQPTITENICQYTVNQISTFAYRTMWLTWKSMWNQIRYSAYLTSLNRNASKYSYGNIYCYF